ncbi:hypothetical protein JCM19376_13420 [Fusibacter bizertensis]
MKSWTVNGVNQETTSHLLKVTLDGDKTVIVEFELISVPPTTETPTNAPTPTEAPTEAPTNASAPTEAVTETITEEDVALGTAKVAVNFDEIYNQLDVSTAEATDAVTILDETVALGDALLQTGQLPTALYMGIGSIIAALGVFMKVKK